MTFFGLWKPRHGIPRHKQTTRQVDVAWRHDEALRRRHEAFGSPPLSEWEREAAYGAVEAERRLVG